MKKSLKKLALNKKAVSNLSLEKIGGRAAQSNDILSCTDPTKLTWCYYCPKDPIDVPSEER
ncbi:hypothetical protein C8N46_101645 [Kordia periserrulae]|uniref:Uncharacterized protein n=1 Tax=Kordia periserrulae TaxID=701523 RepID=A0A2T6C6X5_9FLAO|nr:hypothetical protein [Kordia periserrulae]PTX64035.1 hypothetical protein C8N46_101645 [Kordia periserrulae]